MNEKGKVVAFWKKNGKRILKVFILIICLGVGVIGVTYAVNDITAIGSDNALNYAYSDAGVDPVSATDVKVEFEFKEGQFIYDIEFTSDGVEYEYYVKASNGDIVKKETEALSGSESTTAKITIEEAKSTALSDAGIDEGDVTFTKTELDYDDGVQVYDIEFYSDNTEYEYEINAETGKIYSKSTEKKSSSSSSSSTSSSNSSSSSSSSSTSSTTSSDIITLAKAKSIALSDAGVSSSNVTYTKEKLDYDDGVQVYDIEFYTSSMEYEYEINAKTGKIIEKSSETIKTTSSSSSSYIGLSKAKEIAVSYAGLSTSSVTFIKAKLESDDGIMVYEIEFYYNEVEYECTINATSGDVIEYDYDRD